MCCCPRSPVRVPLVSELDQEVGDAFLEGVADGVTNPFAIIVPDTGLTAKETANIVTNTGTADFLLNGSPFSLPAGKVSASVRLGGGLTRLSSQSETVSDGVASSDLSRDEAHIQVNLDMPVLSPGVTPDFLGDLTLSANGRIDTLSDFETLYTFGYSAAWRPVNGLQLIASFTHEEGAPTVEQLGAPLLRTPNVRLFDFATGTTVDNVARITGGQPNLLNDDRQVIRLNLRAEPFEGFRVIGSYVDQETRNAISAFPDLTPDIEAAFPERFSRDADGALLEIDARPVNFAETARREVRYGFDWSKRIKVEPRSFSEEERKRLREIFARRQSRRDDGRNGQQGPPGAERRQTEAGRQGSGQAGRPRRGPNRGRFGRGGADGRLLLSVFHTVVLRDDVLIDSFATPLDLLGGDAIAASGGVSRHQVQARLGISRRAVTARAGFNWRSEASIAGGETGELTFGDLGTVNLRLVLDPARDRSTLLRFPFLIGSRITIDVDNVLNNRRNVVDEFGVTPVGFQPDLIDPLGRTITVSFRKLIF